jgi:hypothetical protein
MKMNLGSIKRMTIGAIFIAFVVYFGWAIATYYILHAVQGFLLAEIPALDQFDPHLVRAFIAIASLILIVVLRQVLFPFLPQISSWLTFNRSPSGLSSFRLGFFGLWACAIACGSLIQYWAERPNPDRIFSSTGPRANICTHPDGRLTLQSLDTRFDYTDGSPCGAAIPATAAAFQAQRRQDEAASKAAPGNSSDTAAPPSANQPPVANGKNPQAEPKKPTPNPAKLRTSVFHDLSAWANRNFAGNTDVESSAGVAQLPTPEPGPYHIRLRNMTGQLLKVRAHGPINEVREFNLAPDSEFEDTPARSGASILSYTAEAITSNGAGATWRQAVDLSHIEDVFEIDLVPPQSSSTADKGLPQADTLIGQQN